jgi:DNA-binding transcriptional LysR family regulator
MVLADEWQHQPRVLPAGLDRHDLFQDPVQVLLPSRHPVLREYHDALPLSALAGEAWATGHFRMGWEEMTRRTCQDLGGFDPDIRHRAADATISLALVARGLAVTMLPDLPLPDRHPGVVNRPIAEGPLNRTIFTVTRSADAARPSTQAVLGAIKEVAAALPYE